MRLPSWAPQLYGAAAADDDDDSDDSGATHQRYREKGLATLCWPSRLEHRAPSFAAKMLYLLPDWTEKLLDTRAMYANQSRVPLCTHVFDF